MRTFLFVAAVVLQPFVPVGAGEGEPRLVWHVETLAGEQVDSRSADEPINPASVVKVATTLWALEKLGPEHRFATRVGQRGALDGSTGSRWRSS